MTESYINPTEDERRYLVPFEIGISKTLLYGQPVIMSHRSELIKTLLPRLSLTEPNSIAPEENVDPDALIFFWNYINGSSKPPKKLSVEFLTNLWKLLNYFNIDIKSDLMTIYLQTIDEHFSSMIGYSPVMDDILKKVKIIDPMMYNQFTNKIKEYEAKQRMKPLIIIHEHGTTNYEQIDPQNMDNRLMELRYGISTNSQGKKIVTIPQDRGLGSFLGSSPPGGQYTYPEFNKDLNAYVMTSVGATPEELNRDSVLLIGTKNAHYPDTPTLDRKDIPGSLAKLGWDVVTDPDGTKSVKVPISFGLGGYLLGPNGTSIPRPREYDYFTYPERVSTIGVYIMQFKHK